MTVKYVPRERAWGPGNEGRKAALRIGKITLGKSQVNVQLQEDNS